MNVETLKFEVREMTLQTIVKDNNRVTFHKHV